MLSGNGVVQLLTLNNGNQATCGSCYNFTTLLPKDEVSGPAKLSDMWVALNSQETVGVSLDSSMNSFSPTSDVHPECCNAVAKVIKKSINAYF